MTMFSMAREHGELARPPRGFLKHTDCRRRGRLRECRISEHFENDALRARHIRVLEALGGRLGQQPRLRLQRLQAW